MAGRKGSTLHHAVAVACKADCCSSSKLGRRASTAALHNLAHLTVATVLRLACRRPAVELPSVSLHRQVGCSCTMPLLPAAHQTVLGCLINTLGALGQPSCTRHVSSEGHAESNATGWRNSRCRRGRGTGSWVVTMVTGPVRWALGRGRASPGTRPPDLSNSRHIACFGHFLGHCSRSGQTGGSRGMGGSSRAEHLPCQCCRLELHA